MSRHTHICKDTDTHTQTRTQEIKEGEDYRCDANYTTRKTVNQNERNLLFIYLANFVSSTEQYLAYDCKLVIALHSFDTDSRDSLLL